MKKFFSVLFAFTLTASVFAQTAIAPAAGDGTFGNPYQISTWENLYWISQNSTHWNKYYIQTADIDLTTVSPAITTWDGGAGWTPIGYNNKCNTGFTGNYNGNNYTINGLYINRPGVSYIGLFGYTVGACIENLGATNVSVYGKQYTGGLVGYLTYFSKINNSYTTGSINGTDIYVGGLAGFITGSTVQNSYSACSVDGNIYVGGLIGYSSYYSAINSSYATGNVSGNTSTAYYVGGLVGYNASYISNSYSRGNVTRTSGTHTEFGGFAGFNNNTIKYCYNIGSVYYTGSTNPTDKGFVGSSAKAIYTNNLFDSDVSNQTSATGATGKTTAQMKTQGTYVGWDFTNTWEIVGGDGANYPRLQANPDQALPVELTSFTAKFMDGKVSLEWKTATEINNYGFEIQRTMETPTQNQNDIQNWETMGFVEGAGNSNSPKSYQFLDNKPLKASKYYYRLKQIDADGSIKYSEIMSVSLESILTGYSLDQNYPNPFNPTTTIKFELPEKGVVDLRVYNIIGQEIARLINQEMEAGSYEKEFNAEEFTSGMYIYSLKVGDKFSAKKKMLLLK